MLLPQMWLRKSWLRRALRDYPLYDPPHKVEEYLLSREQAFENFDYFMRVRQQRAAYFQRWLRRYFRVAITPDENGVKALNRWGNMRHRRASPRTPMARPRSTSRPTIPTAALPTRPSRPPAPTARRAR